MKPRLYQEEIYNEAKKNNVIVKLNTGSGKTFIAAMLMRDYLSTHSDQKIILLVKSVSLGYQHFDNLKQSLFLKDEIGLFHGKMSGTNIDMWSKDNWKVEMNKYKIVIMTAKVFLDILNHKKFSVENICLLVFDEVHHLSKADDYSQISTHLRNGRHIKILGLTACLIKNEKKPSDVELSIRQIEMKLNCRVVTTSDTIANNFSENITEEILEFKNDDYSNLLAVIDTYIKEFQTPTEDRNESFDGFKKFFAQCQTVIQQLGVIACNMVINKCLKDENTYQEASKFKAFLKDINKKFSEFNVFNGISTKSKVLIDTIKKYPDGSFIIFVDERLKAWALKMLLNELSKRFHEFSFVKCRYVTGHNQDIFPFQINYNNVKLKKVLDDFRKRNFNILIATNVVEEGLDIPHCNVVIKFDQPKDFQSYIQSKGRARATNAKYIILTDKVHETKFSIRKFKLINEAINAFLKNRVIDNDDLEAMNEDFHYNVSKETYAPFGESGPKITLDSASSVLNRYIGKLRGNRLTSCQIKYDTKAVKCDDMNLWVTTLCLPMPCPHLDEISGRPVSNKILSKKLANLEACKILHQKDELNEYLLPHDDIIDEDGDVSVDGDEGSNASWYRKYVAKKLHSTYHKISENTKSLCLYSIEYNPSVFSKLEIDDHSIFETESTIGFLTSRQIHETEILAEFPIYLAGGEVTATIKHERDISVNSDELQILLDCHQMLFSLYAKRIRKFDDRIKFDSKSCECSIIVTILQDVEIHFDKLRTIVKTKQVGKLISYSQNDWVGRVVRPTYVKHEFGAYVITNVDKNLNANSLFEPKNSSYAQYFVNKYQVNFSEDDKLMPLIEVKRLTTILSCVNRHSEKKNKRNKRINESVTRFIPSLVDCISLSSSLWTLLCIFPTVHYRLNQVFVIQEFILSQCFINYQISPKLTFDFNNSFPIERISSSETQMTNASVLFQKLAPCFITKTCDDKVNLELYEILGDSFLKFISSKFLFHFYQSANEGRLTRLRSNLVSNKNLFRLSIKRNLQSFIFYSRFSPKYNYLPPHFVPITNSDEELNHREFMRIKNKVFADCTEAIIGSLIVNFGFNEAIMFLRWIELKLPEDLGNDNLICIPFEMDACSAIPNWIKEIEDVLEYQFCYKAYLIQALTHPSSTENRKYSCYQRLEYLGDAVLDFLVTRHIMFQCRDLSPGKITNLRSALVCNNIFAYLSVKWNLYKHLNYFDEKLFKILPLVVEELLKPGFDMEFSFLKKNEFYKVTIKILGDIFESIAGALFVDSNYNLEIVWRVFQRLMKEPLDKFSHCIPKNKISTMFERNPGLKCNFTVEDHTNLTILTATMPDKQIVVKERNKALCKLALVEELGI